MISKPKYLQFAISKAFEKKKKYILPSSKVIKLKECIDYAATRLQSVMGNTNTTRNESFHYLNTRFCPKDIHAYNQYEGKMGFTVLVHNLGRTEALKTVSDSFGIKFPQRIIDQAVSAENHTTEKREREITFKKEIHNLQKSKKESKKRERRRV